MYAQRRTLLLGGAALAGVAMLAQPLPARAASRESLRKSGALSLQTLYTEQPNAKILADKAVGILVFPTIVQAGFVVGAETGDGVLFKGETAESYYNISSASFGLQAGAQSFAYALFFMHESALEYLHKSAGWAIGSGPSVVVLDKSAAASVTSTTLSHDVYAIPYGNQGLMAGLSLEGSKITRIHPDA
jgi:lipid-binding SYLF domain-containing protein